MVRREGSRFGVATNQSVRRSNVTAKHQESNQYVVVKTMATATGASKKSRRVLEEFSQQVQDGNLAVITDDSENTANPILYSLNKHKRWELPEMLRENILEKENHDDSKYQVTLSERHISVGGKDVTATSADCIAVHQTKNEHQKRVPKKTYAFESDLKASGKKSRRRRQRKMEEEREEEEIDGLEEDLIPQIHYEVCYPRPRNKYQNHGKANKSTEVSIKTGKKSGKKATLNAMEWDEYGLEDFEEYDDDEAFVPSQYENACYTEEQKFEMPEPVSGEVVNDSTSVTLGNVLVTLLIDAVCAKTEPEKSKQRKRHRSRMSVSSLDYSDVESKDHIQVVDKEDIDRFQPKDEYVPESRQKNTNKRQRLRKMRGSYTPKPEPVKVADTRPAEDPELKFVRRIAVQSLKSDLLRKQFGENYVEGHCTPRRFAINMKPVVVEHLRSTGHERTAETVAESGQQMMILFEPFGCVNGVLGSKQPAYQLVRLKVYGFPKKFTEFISVFTQNVCLCPIIDYSSSYPYDAIKMENPENASRPAEPDQHTDMCVFSISNVQEVAEVFKTKIAQSDPLSFYRYDGAIGWIAKQPPVTLETVKTVTRIEWCASTPNQVMQQVLFESDRPQTTSASGGKPANCSICYDSLLPSVHGTDASALTTCHHWFCNECWTQHLRSRVKQGDINISCPEFDCDTPVDKILLLTYLTTKEFRIQSLHHRNTTLNCQPDWTWCPNTACGRLVKVIGQSDVENGSAPPAAINCECGVLWCSACKAEGHWPATCEQAVAYWKLIKKNGTIQWNKFSGLGDIRHVRVKKCPYCKNFIEKHTGCNYIMCVCGRAFCWDCLQDWMKHDSQNCGRNAAKLQRVALKQSKPIVSSMPGIALQHRERRTRLAVMKRRKAAEVLAKKAFLHIQGPKDPSLPCLPSVDDTCSIASSSASSTSSILTVSSYKTLPLTWIQDDEESWQLLQELMETAASAAKFCSEAEFCLEYLEVLCNDPNTELKSSAVLMQLKNRLIFITDQLHMIIHGEIKVNADSAMGRVSILMHAGKKCLKWIAANVPLVLSQQEEV